MMGTTFLRMRDTAHTQVTIDVDHFVTYVIFLICSLRRTRQVPSLFVLRPNPRQLTLLSLQVIERHVINVKVRHHPPFLSR